MKINQTQQIIIAITIVLLTFAFVQYQNNNRQLDLQEQKAKQERIELEKQKTAEETRKRLMNTCISLADDVYWEYMELNGKKNADGTITAPSSDWKRAEEKKQIAIEICKIRFSK